MVLGYESAINLGLVSGHTTRFYKIRRPTDNKAECSCSIRLSLNLRDEETSRKRRTLIAIIVARSVNEYQASQK